MSAKVDTQAVQATRDRIVSLLGDLPAESLNVVEQFVRFLRQQAQRRQLVVTTSAEEERLPYAYPTIPLPASVLDGLIGIMPPAGGDALADTEALYDEV